MAGARDARVHRRPLGDPTNAIAAKPQGQSCLEAASINDVDPGAAPTPPPPPPVPELPSRRSIASFAAPPATAPRERRLIYRGAASKIRRERVNACLKAGMLTFRPDDRPGHGEKLRGECFTCSAPHEATIRDVLYQPTYGGNDYECGGEDGAVARPFPPLGMYVTGLCSGQPSFDSGKFPSTVRGARTSASARPRGPRRALRRPLFATGFSNAPAAAATGTQRAG